jgi:hypothetical protein
MFDVSVHPAQLSDVAQVFNWEHLNFDSAVSEKACQLQLDKNSLAHG